MARLPHVSELLPDVEAAARPWLRSATLREGSEGRLAVEVPTAFVRDALRLRLQRSLDAAARSRGFTAVEILVALPTASPFASFRVTPGNQLAYAAVTSLLSRERSELHPLVLHGPEGSGKSHLLSALASTLRGKGRRDLLSTQVPKMAKRLGLSAREGSLASFRRAFRTPRMLILDQAEKLEGKPKVQSEIVHALDALSASGGTAVLALREAPDRMAGLSAPLRSRLVGGLVVSINR